MLILSILSLLLPEPSAAGYAFCKLEAEKVNSNYSEIFSRFSKKHGSDGGFNLDYKESKNREHMVNEEKCSVADADSLLNTRRPLPVPEYFKNQKEFQAYLADSDSSQNELILKELLIQKDDINSFLAKMEKCVNLAAKVSLEMETERKGIEDRYVQSTINFHRTGEARPNPEDKDRYFRDYQALSKIRLAVKEAKGLREKLQACQDSLINALK